ncbi:endolytic transglycosylase MltG [Bifidobacterium canis]|uniref:Endolytic murein transglycosylase n=1 Tax=Bifidobacterium canis TaxID=2610880 RepID=A0A7K1J3B4_9BIFI|nr:YceG-like family [Bifidobacterium canis]
MSDDLHDFFESDEAWEGNAGVSPLPPSPPRSRREMRRQRALKKRKRLILVVILVVSLVVVAVGGVFATRAIKSWRHANMAQESVAEDYSGPGDSAVAFTIKQGQGVMEVANALQNAEIVKSSETFATYVSSNNLTLYPGTYALKTHMKASQVAQVLSDQGNAKGFAEVRQGERVSEVIDRICTDNDIDKSKFEAIINNKDEAAKILPAEANGNFEGWLEPGTYTVGDVNTAPERLLKEMVQARIKKLDELKVPEGEDREKTLIIASIVEAEVNSSEYYSKVSRVIYNRLSKNMTLGMDSTVAYGAGVNGMQLTNDQLQDASNPYNTRINKGLPPTPISNPGDDAITAALHPADGNWLYFVTTNLSTGETKFAETDEEFQKLVQEYRSNNPDAN